MAKSLETIFTWQDKEIGFNANTGGNQKLAKSPWNARDRKVVPSYNDEFVFQNARKQVQIDLNKMVSSNSNWERLNNNIIKRVDRTVPSVPEYDYPRKRVREA